MQWRYVKGALLGGLLGFAGQFLFDFVFLHPQTQKQDGTYEWEPGGSSVYNYFCRGGVDRTITTQFPVQHRAQAHQLFFECLLIDWLYDRGDLAGQTAVWTAILAGSFLAMRDRTRQSKKRLADGLCDLS